MTSNTTKRARLIDGDEVDAVESRQYYNWRSRQVSTIKRRIRRRERHQARTELRTLAS